MISIQREGILIAPTSNTFEEGGVLNPAVIRDGEYVHLLYRAVQRGNYSTIGYCRLRGPLTVDKRNTVAFISPEASYESHGVEDPRIVKIDDLYYLSYCAYDGVNAMGALATSRDLVSFERRGLIVPQFSYEEMSNFIYSNGPINEKYKRYNTNHELRPQDGTKKMVWDKNVVFFPRRIGGKLWFLHRIKPDIQVTCVNSLAELTPNFWSDYLVNLAQHIALEPKYDHEVSYIGAGCPPIETDVGWLIIYHGVHDTMNGYVYSACAALMELGDPSKEIARLPYPLLFPENSWEFTGEVNNVIFPTGTTVFGDTLYIYYGAADARIACASLSLSGLTKELLNHQNHDHHENIV